MSISTSKNSDFSSGETIGTLPVCFRPAEIACGHVSGEIDIELCVQPNGEVQVRKQSSSGSIGSPVMGTVVFSANTSLELAEYAINPRSTALAPVI